MKRKIVLNYQKQTYSADQVQVNFDLNFENVPIPDPN